MKRAPRPRRARQPEQKIARQSDILRAARELFEATSYADLTMSQIAERARLAKGTLYLYYPTKEAMFLALFDREMDAWLAELCEKLTRSEAKRSIPSVVEIFGRSLEGRECLIRLHVILHTVLEENVEIADIHAFKLALLEKLKPLAAAFESRFDFLRGKGLRFVLQAHAFSIGIWQLSHPPRRFRGLLERADLRALKTDFNEDFVAGVSLLLEGYRAQGAR